VLRKRVLLYALLSAGAAVVPVPGVGIIVDSAMALSLIVEIKTSLHLDHQSLTFLYGNPTFVQQALAMLGVFANVTFENLPSILSKIGPYISAEQAVEELVKYIPLAGQAVSGALSFGTTVFVGNYLIDQLKQIAINISTLAAEEYIRQYYQEEQSDEEMM